MAGAKGNPIGCADVIADVTVSTEIDWDALLADLQSKDAAARNGALTTEEISERTGKGVRVVRRMVRSGLADGRIERVDVMRPTIRGTQTPVPAWRVVAK